VQGSLTEGSIRVGLFKFSLPILFANTLQSLNGSVNSIWVGGGWRHAHMLSAVTP
jgi:Na+-driven multidrug efflux pump